MPRKPQTPAPTLDDLHQRIHVIRGLHVMLDEDLAALYGVKRIRLREQIKRNPERFPGDFMFQLISHFTLVQPQGGFTSLISHFSPSPCSAFPNP
jgi:hypothetical protein